MTTDSRILIIAGLLAVLPVDTIRPPRAVVLVVGEDDDDADAAPPDAQTVTPAERRALEEAARQYLDARRKRIEDERSTDPDEQE